MEVRCCELGLGKKINYSLSLLTPLKKAVVDEKERICLISGEIEIYAQKESRYLLEHRDCFFVNEN